jgi:transcriptional regulator with XRE-family HTH domain
MARKANGAAIKALREALGLTQETVAQRVGVSRVAISLVESGGGMTAPNLRRVAEALGVPMDAVSSGETEPAEAAS